MSTTASITMTALWMNDSSSAPTIKQNDRPRFIRCRLLDANGLDSGHRALLTSSDTTIAKVTTAEEKGNAPAGIVPVGPGTCTITATASDASSVTATMTVTVQ